MVKILYYVNVLGFSAHVKCTSSNIEIEKFKKQHSCFAQVCHNPTFLPHTDDDIKQMY